MTDGGASDKYDSPPGYYRTYEFDDGRVSCLAKLAHWIPGDPNRLYTVKAREISVDDVEITPPGQHPDDSDWSDMLAFTVYDPETIIYFLETWQNEAELGMVGSLATIELHELTHLAISEEDDATGTDHWTAWNDVCGQAVDYVTDNGWEEIGLEPAAAGGREERELEQADLTTYGGV